MDHDHELLREEIVFASRTVERGPIPEFLAKKRAEQARGTAAGYQVVLGVFQRICKEQGIDTVGHIVEGVAHDFITDERQRGMSARTIHDRVRKLKTWTRWIAQARVEAVLSNYVRLRHRYLARRSRRRARPGDDRQRIVTERHLETDCFLISQMGQQLQGDSVAWVLKRLCARLGTRGLKMPNCMPSCFATTT